ncbi:MAG: NADH-quinone oxidoreductase subunit A [Candidatus Anammoximicrobium sp.]|nr:NADH-quinone oxidoreductase subunit A [Candidatus Anammoximicrobium sp.]
MSSGAASSLGIVAYLALFAAVGILVLFVALLLGRFVRPRNSFKEKRDVYECGEPAIGSSFIQFDLRFYVVALLFIIFDVEVAFFFPWATVFGKAMHLADGRVQTVESASLRLTDDARLLYRELGVNQPSVPTAIPASLSGQVAYTDDARRLAADVIQASSRQLAWITILDIGLFFAILMVGFAYVWKRGDLDWVRAVGRDRAGPATPASGAGEFVEEPVYSA